MFPLAIDYMDSELDDFNSIPYNVRGDWDDPWVAVGNLTGMISNVDNDTRWTACNNRTPVDTTLNPPTGIFDYIFPLDGL